ncbi:MAG TPA: hypothetical protein VI299_00485 [Polyangiales bacterium]
MRKTWFMTGMLSVGFSLLTGCGNGHGDDLGGSADPLKGHGKDASPEPASACAAVLCPADSKCVVEQVQCVRAPCPPVARCEPIAPGPVDASVVAPTDASAPTTCAATTCLTGSICVDTPEGARCDELKCTAKCSAGQHCVLQEVQCIRAPCYPVPTCVDDVDGCARVRCKAGTHCELKQVQCITTPCDPVPECVAN